MDGREKGGEGQGATAQLIADNTKNFLIMASSRAKDTRRGHRGTVKEKHFRMEINPGGARER